MHRFWDIRLQKCRDFENQVRVHEGHWKCDHSIVRYRQISWTCPVLLTFCSNYGCISCCFWDFQCRKMLWPWNPGQRPLKVIGTDKDRSDTYDFLLMFHSNHGPISYHYRDNGDFIRKSQNFPTAVYFAPQLQGFPSELGMGAGGQKNRMMGLPGWAKSLTMSSAVWIQYTNVTDGRTDWETPGDSKDRAYA